MEFAIEIVKLITALAGLAAAVVALVPEARSRLRPKIGSDRKH